MGNGNSSEDSHVGVETVLGELRMLEQKVSSIHVTQRQQVEALTHELGSIQKEDRASKKDDGVYLFGSHVRLGTASVVVGPVVGKVTETTARVLLEVDTDAEISCHVCLLDDICPGGRQVAVVTKELRANRPAVFQIQELTEGTKYHFSFSGLLKRDSIQKVGSFRAVSAQNPLRVAGICGNSPAYACDTEKESVWGALAERVQKDQLDLILHAGGQVDLRRKIQKCSTLLERAMVDTPDKTAVLAAEKTVADELRQAYRFAWNVPQVQFVLANCPNLMIWSDMELPVMPSRNTLQVSQYEYYYVRGKKYQGTDATYPEKLLVLAQRVYREYQRALWDDSEEYLNNLDWGAEGSGNEEGYFTSVREDVGLLFIDSRGSQFNPDGKATPWPGKALISAQQLDFIRDTLSENKSLRTLVVVADRPIVRFGPTVPNTEAGHDQWSNSETEQATLINLLFSWKSSTNILLLCGAGPYDAVSETTLVSTSRDLTRKQIKQLVTSPVTSCYGEKIDERCAFDAPKSGEFPLAQFVKDDPIENFEKAVLKKLFFTNAFASTSTKSRVFATFEVQPQNSDSFVTSAKLIQSSIDGRGKPNIILGPFIGKVTDNEANVVIEMDRNCELTCQYEDLISGKKTVISKRNVLGQHPFFFHLDNMKPDWPYQVTFPDFPDAPKCNFHTMPSLEQIANQVEYKIAMVVTFGDFIHHLSPEEPSLWGMIKEQLDSREPIQPTFMLNLGNQIDLVVIEDELRSIVRAFGRGRKPEEIERKELELITNRICGAVRGLYRTSWEFPGKRDILSGRGNLVLVSTQDVRSPPCFRESPDLVPWVSLVESSAATVAAEYQKAMNGIVEESNPDSVCKFTGFHSMGGGVGVITLALNTRRYAGPNDAYMLTSHEWARLDEAIQVSAKHIRTLVIAIECPVIDNSPLDAKTKAMHPQLHDEVIHGWPYHEDETLRLLDLIFAWKSQENGREALFCTGSPNFSFQTSLTHAQTKINIQQICIGPVTARPNNQFESLPFEPEGTVDLPQLDGHNIRDACYNYKHHSPLLGDTCFALVDMGTARQDGICFMNTYIYSSKQVPDVLDTIPCCSWMMAALATGERAKENSRGSAKSLKKEKEKLHREKSMREMLTEYPNITFPESVRDGTDAEVKEPGTEPPMPPPAKTEFTVKFKWLDIDIHIYEDNVAKKLKKWYNFVAEVEGTKDYLESVESIYRQFADENVGVAMENIPKLTTDLFIKSIPKNVREMIIPTNLPSQSLSQVVVMATYIVLKRRHSTLLDSLAARKPMGLPDVLPLCESVAAMIIISTPIIS